MRKDFNDSYSDLEFNVETTVPCSLDDIFYLQDIKQRKLFLNDEINSLSIAPIVRNILQYNSEDKGLSIEERKPILLYISSNGGDIDAGFELIDVIMSSLTKVYTINLGFQYSMGFLIGLAGHKRYGTRNAKYLQHDGQNLVFNSGAKAHDQMEFNKRVEKRVKEYVLSRSNLSSEEYDSKLRIEWYMFSEEAKEKGFVDYIVGQDCELDEII